jgi:hypothetical protein
MRIQNIAFLEHIIIFKNFGKKLAENLFRSGSGSGHLLNRMDPQHCREALNIRAFLTCGLISCLLWVQYSDLHI